MAHDLAISGSYQGTIPFTFPTVEEGAYYLILSVDDEWKIVELRQLNNEYAASANALVPALQEGVPQNVTFGGKSLADHYRADVTGGKNLVIPFSSTVPGIEVYVRFEALPSRGVYDYRMDMEEGELLIPAAATGTWLECNAYWDRLDLNDANLKVAKDMGIKISIGTDAHSVEGLLWMKFGIATARRGWLEAADVVNTYPLEKLLAMRKLQRTLL